MPRAFAQLTGFHSPPSRLIGRVTRIDALATKVPPTLHTPLMSGANAISGITLVGALYAARTSEVSTSNLPGALALASVNVVGGFLVTDRMLRMFGRKR